MSLKNYLNKIAKKKLEQKDKLTLLEQFIIHETTSYSKQSVDLSEKKYLSSLLLITNFTQKEIAQASHVSYGLLRKWNTEKKFKKQVENNVDSFERFFISSISDEINNHLEKILSYTRKTNEEFPKFPTYLISDSQIYHKVLAMKIWDVIEKICSSSEQNIIIVEDETGKFFEKDLTESDSRLVALTMLKLALLAVGKKIILPYLHTESKSMVMAHDMLTIIQRGILSDPSMEQSKKIYLIPFLISADIITS